MSAATKTNPSNPDQCCPAGAPSNPHARQVADLRAVLLDTLTRDEMREIGVALILRAKGGNVSAAKLLFQYTLGKPVAQPHPDRLDADEVQAFRDNRMNRDAADAIGSTPVAPALAVMRELLPARAEEFLDELRADHLYPVTKREVPGRTKPMSAPKGAAPAETESIRLVNQPPANGRP